MQRFEHKSDMICPMFNETTSGCCEGINYKCPKAEVERLGGGKQWQWFELGAVQVLRGSWMLVFCEGRADMAY